MKNTQSGRSSLSILIVIIVVVMAAMGVYLWTHRGGQEVTVHGTSSPDIGDVAQTPHQFTDGLGQPDSSTTYPLDEFGAGVARRDVFMRDINGDGQPDRITRARVENATGHGYDDYTVELHVGDRYRDITPADFRTVEGADCALQKIQFVFEPTVRIIKISRPWRDSWNTPTMASRTTYRMMNGVLRPGGAQAVKEVCDVADLF